MSPLALWCCEAQERYVLLVNAASLNRFVSICSEFRSL
jgi:phosphoribosylformylglycinamidine synthase